MRIYGRCPRCKATICYDLRREERFEIALVNRDCEKPCAAALSNEALRDRLEAELNA